MAYYFAYGTNLAEEKMVAEYPSARFYKFGFLKGYRLNFTSQKGEVGEGIASIVPGSESDYVEGVIYEVDSNEIKDPRQGSAMSLMGINTHEGSWGKAYVYFCFNSDFVTPSVENFSAILKKYNDYGFNTSSLEKILKEVVA